MTGDIDFSEVFEDLPAPYAILDTDLRFVTVNECYVRETRRTREQLIGKYIFDVFPETPERIDTFKTGFEKAVGGEYNSIERQPFSIDEANMGSADQIDSWWTTHQVPVRDKDDSVIAILLKAEDVTEAVEVERTRDVVIREFDHRMNNMLAKVTAIARRTGKAHSKIADFMPHFEARIEAMAKTQQLLLRTKWDDVELIELAEQEFAPYRDTDDERISVSGPDIRINGAVAQALGMAFHELATNAAKYGALAVPKGEVELSWRYSESPGALIIEWVERGLPKIENMPEPSGFGSMIIDKFTPIETGGTVERCFDAHSMTCTITLPQNEN